MGKSYGIGSFVIGSLCIFGLKTMQEKLLSLANFSIGKTLPNTSPLLIQTDRAHILKFLKH